MESGGVNSASYTMENTASASAAMPSPSNVADTSKATQYEFDPSVSEEERRFYLKAYPTVDVVRDRKTHCTVCKVHIGTAPVQENGIKMHPILRVTHCNKCHDFYNSGEFSKGEDGSELYCRWCGQGGEVYCCSSCPYVFCKSCIVKNLSRGVVADIEQNENWNCFSCAPKILWPLRAQHWALMNYIEQQKKEIYAMNLSEAEIKQHLAKDRSKCCRLAKAKCGNMSDSMESLDSITSKRSHASTYSAKKPVKHAATPSPQQSNSAKRTKTNDEVVCTPDLLSMLEPDCQITVSSKTNRPLNTPSASTPKIMSIQQPPGGYGAMSSTPKSSVPPPLVLRNTGVKLRAIAPPPIVRRTIVGPRTPNPSGNGTPVYHTINGYRIDLNSAAQQETFRLPNGKLIQVKRQGPPPTNISPSPNNWQQMSTPQPQRIVPQTIASRPVQITAHPYNINVQQQQSPQVIRYHSNMIGATSINQINHNGAAPPMQVHNGQIPGTAQPQVPPQLQQGPARPVMIRHVFPDTPIGQARTGLQDQVFNAMEICTHLTNKVQTLTYSNAYKQARSYLEVKELYIHLSYLLTYAIGRFKSLQDKCLGDMRTLGFGSDADCLENGQLAAAVDYVCYGQLDDVDLFNTGTNSFHNQVYEYRKSLHANLKEGEDGAKSPLPPLFPLGQGKTDDLDDDPEGEDSLLEEPKSLKNHWLEGGCEDSPVPPTSYNQENEENEEPDDSFLDNDDDEIYNRNRAKDYGDSFLQGTEEAMRKNEENYAYDRKLTRLVSQYPSIWCTRHPDYGNFEITRKQWHTIASHFDNKDQIKLRWKNIRKRFVRIEKRIAEGKRFNGHYDKAMAFLANRDLPEDQWVSVDCGEDDGDTFDRHSLDAIEQTLHVQGKDDSESRDKLQDKDKHERSLFGYQPAVRPIEVESLDLKIITFVKSNPVLWRKSMDPEADKIDEETRKAVWAQLENHMPNVSGEYIRDRWQHLYEMYKTFRLKTIKSLEDRANLELKYSKYLAKLYFLYKIDEHELRNENNGLFEDCFELEEDEENEKEQGEMEQEEAAESNKNNNPPVKLQDMPDDKEFLKKLIVLVREYPAIWNTKHDDYNDIMIRDNYWQEINEKLKDFKRDVKSIKLRWQLAKFSYYRWKRENGQILENTKMGQYCKNLPIDDMKFLDKQASDDDENEIEIVEPKTDLITLDSDDDEPTTPANTQSNAPTASQSHSSAANMTSTVSKVKCTVTPPTTLAARDDVTGAVKTAATNASTTPTMMPLEENIDFMSMAQNFLASMLEVEVQDENRNSPGSSDSSQQKKQPRKKLTNKPNPTLLKQKALMERERLEEMKRNDQKLKMKCAVELKKAEEEYPFTKDMLKARAEENQQIEETKQKSNEEENIERGEGQVKFLLETDKETVEVELIIEDDNLNSSGEQNVSSILKELNAENEEKKTCAREEESNELNEEVTNNCNIESKNNIGNNALTEDKNKDEMANIEKAVKESVENEMENKESNETNKENISESNTGNEQINTTNGVNKLNNELLEDSTDVKQIVSNEKSMETDVNESSENVDDTTNSNTEIEMDVDKEIEKVLRQRRVDDINGTESILDAGDKTELPNKQVIEESNVNDDLKTTDKEQRTANDATAVATPETTTSNGSV